MNFYRYIRKSKTTKKYKPKGQSLLTVMIITTLTMLLLTGAAARVDLTVENVSRVNKYDSVLVSSENYMNEFVRVMQNNPECAARLNQLVVPNVVIDEITGLRKLVTYEEETAATERCRGLSALLASINASGENRYALRYKNSAAAVELTPQYPVNLLIDPDFSAPPPPRKLTRYGVACRNDDYSSISLYYEINKVDEATGLVSSDPQTITVQCVDHSTPNTDLNYKWINIPEGYFSEYEHANFFTRINPKSINNESITSFTEIIFDMAHDDNSTTQESTWLFDGTIPDERLQYYYHSIEINPLGRYNIKNFYKLSFSCSREVKILLTLVSGVAPDSVRVHKTVQECGTNSLPIFTSQLFDSNGGGGIPSSSNLPIAFPKLLRARLLTYDNQPVSISLKVYDDSNTILKETTVLEAIIEGRGGLGADALVVSKPIPTGATSNSLPVGLDFVFLGNE